MRINDILQNNFLIQLSLAAAGEVTPAFFVLSKNNSLTSLLLNRHHKQKKCMFKGDFKMSSMSSWLIIINHIEDV